MNKSTMTIVNRSFDVMTASYSPYSRFKVGASILSVKGNIYSGANIENSSYGATLCAEATAIALMLSAGETLISEIAITCSKSKLCYPCGICLQRISEFSDNSTLIHVCIDKKAIETLKLIELYPFPFRKEALSDGEKLPSCFV